MINCGNVAFDTLTWADSYNGTALSPAEIADLVTDGSIPTALDVGGDGWFVLTTPWYEDQNDNNVSVEACNDLDGCANDFDKSHYFGRLPCVNVTKAVRVWDADTEMWGAWMTPETPEEGPTAFVGDKVEFNVTICNCGNDPITLDSYADEWFAGDPDPSILPYVEWLEVDDAIDCDVTLEPGMCNVFNSTVHPLGSEECAMGPQYSDNFTITARYNGFTVSDSDWAYYTLACPCIDVTKEIWNETGCTWDDANTAMDAVPFGEGDTVDLQFNVTNCGNVNLTNILYTDLVDGTLDDLGWTCDIPEPFEPGESFTCTADMTAECGMHYDVVNVSGEYDGIKVSDQDPAYYNVICDKWCGLTIGFWQNNVGKYLDGANGRQVCDEFFETVSPADVTGGVCGSDPTCYNWSCVYHILALDTEEWKPQDSDDKALRQIVALNLTIELYGGEGSASGFILDASDFECKDLIPDCEGDEYCPEHTDCADSIREACGADSCYVTTAWQYVLGLYDAGDEYGKAYEIADCINNYKFGCYEDVSYECTAGCYPAEPCTDQCDPIDCDSCSCSIVYGDEILGDLIDSLICNDMSSFDGCDWVTSLVEEPQETEEDATLNPAGKAPPGQNKDKENKD